MTTHHPIVIRPHDARHVGAEPAGNETAPALPPFTIAGTAANREETRNYAMNPIHRIALCPSEVLDPRIFRISAAAVSTARLLLVVVLAAVLAGCGGAAPQATVIPVFPTPRVQTPAAARGDTLLPTDCTEVLPDGLVAALLAQPVDAVSSHTVLGVGSPSVGLLERLDCGYRRRGDTTTATLQLRAQAYTDPGAASRHLAINVAAEGAAVRTTQNIAIGTAPAVLLTEPGRSVLMLTDARVNLTISLFDAVVPTLATPAVLVDLAQRVLPTLAPETTTTPAPPGTTRPPGPSAAPRSGTAPAVHVGTHT